MIFKVVLISLFIGIVGNTLFNLFDAGKKRRKRERAERRAARERQRRQNEEAVYEFRLQLNREQLLRECARWDTEGKWE